MEVISIVIMKKKLIALLCVLSVCYPCVPVYADDPFKGWNKDNKESAWAVLETTDWSSMQDFLTLDTLNNTVSADVSIIVRGYETELRRIINTTNLSSSDGLVELMLAIMQVMGGSVPPVNDPYNVKVWIDPTIENINSETSIKKILYRLDSARKSHPSPDKVSYFVNSDELRSVIQSVVFSNRYVQQYEKYSLQTATDFYNENKTEFDAKGISPSVSFANDVSAIFKTTSTVGNSNNQSSVIQGGSNVSINAVGTPEGIEVVNYAAQFIGNPYVYGGNSLTNGIDCSGFTQQVFRHFGYNITRTTNTQIHDGVGISYEEASAGDIILYPGHVAILTGDGGIVHASNSAPYPKGGIKYTANALYRDYIAVRRILRY